MPPDRSSAPPVRSPGQRFGRRGSATILSPRRSPGFSLIELMVVVVVFAILLLVGVPSMQTLLMNNRMTSRMNALSASLQLVRAEAVKRNATAALACKTSPAANGKCWEQGWNAYVERDGAPGPDINPNASDTSCAEIDHEDIENYGTTGGASDSSRDCLLWQEESQTELTVGARANTTTTGSDIIRVEFGGAGSSMCVKKTRPDPDTPGAPPTYSEESSCYFVFCDQRGNESARALLLSSAGHVRVSRKDPQNQALVCP